MAIEVVPTEQTAQMLYYVECMTCHFRSNFTEDRRIAIADGWRHKSELENLGLGEHDVRQMRCLFISEPDRP